MTRFMARVPPVVHLVANRLAALHFATPPHKASVFASLLTSQMASFFLLYQLANITGTMKQLGMWGNTLMVLTSDVS